MKHTTGASLSFSSAHFQYRTGPSSSVSLCPFSVKDRPFLHLIPLSNSCRLLHPAFTFGADPLPLPLLEGVAADAGAEGALLPLLSGLLPLVFAAPSFSVSLRKANRSSAPPPPADAC